MSRSVIERDLRMPEYRDVSPDDLEFRGDGKIVRKDRFITGMRDIAWMFFNGDYEIPDIVARVKFARDLATDVIEAAADEIWESIQLKGQP